MIGLTRQQQSAFEFIAGYIKANGRAPSMLEIALALGLTAKSNAHRLLCALEERGYVRRLPGRARAIEVVAQASGVALNPEIKALTARYAKEHGIKIETAVNELLRSALEAA